MQEEHINLNKLVSLTFDENPEVRKEAAKELSKHDDPAALFALVELSYDKEPTVREVAQSLLSNKKEDEKDVMSFAELFSRGEKKIEQTQKDRVLDPITQIFERRLGKERADIVKKMMMPSIEKMYQKAGQSHKKEGEGKVMQEFLTSYLEVISDLDHLGGNDGEVLESVPHDVSITASELVGGIGELGSNEKSDVLSGEISVLENEHIEEIKEENHIEKLPDTFFKKAYEIMMLSGGDDDIMKKEMSRMIDDASREITLAFNLAKKKFKETKITNITKITDGMRNINTDSLSIVKIENKEYQKSKKALAVYTRVVVNDEEGNEGVLYLFDDKGKHLKPEMKLKVQKGIAKSFKFSAETVLILSKKSNLYIVL